MINVCSKKAALVLLAGAASLSVAAPAIADESAVHGMVAAGVAMTPDYEGSDDYEVAPLAMARVNYNRYYAEIVGPKLKVNVSPSERIEYGPVVGYRGKRDDDVDSVAVSRMREVDSAVEVGAFVKVPYYNVFADKDTFSLQADIATDVSDAHDGTMATFGVGYGRQLSEKFSVDSTVSTTYATENYNQTYFGVDADNAARSGLSQFDAEEGFKDVSLRVSGRYALNESWGIMGMTGYKKLIGDAGDSPIVDQEGDDAQWFGGMGVAYKF